MTVTEFIWKILEKHVDPHDDYELEQLNEINFILEKSYVGDMTVDEEAIIEILEGEIQDD